MLKFEIRHIIVDEEILNGDDLEFVNNFGVDTVQMREMKCKKNQIKIN
jgi:hypothetical protein